MDLFPYGHLKITNMKQHLYDFWEEDINLFTILMEQ